MATGFGERSRHGGVDEIPLPVATGRLWLCGKHFVGPDAEAALERTGATAVVCLNERHEIADRYPDYVRWLEANRPARATWFPIPDLHAPDLDVVRPLLEDLRRRLAAGEGLLVHCGAGVGRAGTIAAAVLMTFGVPMDAALQTVADHRPMAGPQCAAQVDLLEGIAGEGG